MVGFAAQDITYTLYILLGGAALTFVVCVPPWPIYNKDPVKWLPAKKSSRVTGIDITVDGKRCNKCHKLRVFKAYMGQAKAVRLPSPGWKGVLES
ncbi:unnamed protein product [Aureobasidium pullulans]|nr:unnamed protein product [Aureobasidium pullulans]